jgi:hypothetical protein
MTFRFGAAAKLEAFLPRTRLPRANSTLPRIFPAAGLALRGRSVRGIEFSAPYKHAPQSALRDPKLCELLALVDAIREGRARERKIAIRELTMS